MWILILKWICFIVVCLDSIAYIIDHTKSEEPKKFSQLLGLLVGIAMRVYLLYGTYTCWIK